MTDMDRDEFVAQRSRRGMTDLVERLTVEHSDTTRQQLLDLCHDAADEIERLRAALQGVLDIGDASSGNDWGDLTLSREIARVALGKSVERRGE